MELRVVACLLVLEVGDWEGNTHPGSQSDATSSAAQGLSYRHHAHHSLLDCPRTKTTEENQHAT